MEDRQSPYEELKARIAQLEGELAKPTPPVQPNRNPALRRPRAPTAAERKTAKQTVQIVGLVLLVLGLFAWGQSGNSILILGIIVGFFLLAGPEAFMS